LLSPEDALELLDAPFGDSAVRMYAVERISNLSDDLIKMYMLQLVQALMYEPHHYSPLGELLLERSLNNVHQVGHEFFWGIRSLLHLKVSYERYSLLAE
jgi:phosphatidylinositol-4,5-bisphosphate 3-kinase catalytic subunit alpha/beta/delta